MTSPLSDVKIKFDAAGQGTVELNGEDISNKVRGVNVLLQSGELSLVNIQFIAEVEIEGTGMASNVFGMNTLQMIEGLSPGDIERDALAGLGMGDNVTEAILTHLKKRIRDAAELG